MTDSKKLNILVIHGYAQTAAIVSSNTTRLRDELKDIADLHYAEGPEVLGSGPYGSRPWWTLQYEGSGMWEGQNTSRWRETVGWWKEHLSHNSYDGVIGLSQGSAMTSILISMLNNPDKAPEFRDVLPQPLKFGIMCSGFVSRYPGHFVNVPADLPTLHTVDPKDSIVAASQTVELFKLCKNAQLKEHDEGHNIPVRGDWPKIMKEFIVNASAQK